MTQIATHSKSGTSINTSVKSNTLRNDSTDINCLKTFDTAVLAYHMMGLRGCLKSPVVGSKKF
ncbi:hypothetical protein [Nostoc sp.]|uniref:hypothetical protein n=1 Tax=Nostoc sp. TaxID=1180 RepID=UPI002FFA5042